MIFEFKPSFAEQYRAVFTVMFRSPVHLFLMPLFPLAGLAILVLTFLAGSPLTFGNFVAVIACFAIIPGVTALNVWSSRRKNRTVQGVLRYTVDDNGLGISSPAFNLLLKWSAINRVRETKRYFLFYISARGAYFIPKSVVTGQMDELRAVIARNVGIAPDTVLTKNSI